MANDMPKARQEVRTVDARPASRAEPALEGFEHRFATVDGIRLRYVAWGKLTATW